MRRLSALFLLLLCHSLVKAQAPEDVLPAWDKDTISIHSPKDAERLRQEIKTYVWGDSAEAGKMQFEENVRLRRDLPGEYTKLRHLRSADRLTIPLRNGFNSIVYLLHPKKSNGSHIPLIYHSGHQVVFFREDHNNNDSVGCATSVLEFFLEKGFDIIGISMPLVGYNTFPPTVTESGREFSIHKNTHDDLFQLERPFYYFLEPVKASVDFFSQRQGYRKFIMMGLSGGGWTTTLYSAIDTRIWLSFPVAGSIPNPLRTQPRDKGDKEQYDPGFYDRFNYSTLYALAAEGPGRMTCQILNQQDNCCFAFDADKFWAPNVRARLSEMDEPGQYEFYFDTCAPYHKVSAVAIQIIYGNIKRAFAQKGYALK